MTLDFRETPDRIIVYFSDAKILDEEAREGLRAIFQRAAESAKRLTFNLRGVEFVSAEVMGMMVRLNNLAKQESLDLRLSNIGRNVLDLLNETGLNKLFQIDEDDDDDPGFLGSPAPLRMPRSTLDSRADPST